jgi:hypothetical protein
MRRTTLIFTIASLLSLFMIEFVAHASPLRVRKGELIRVAATADGAQHERGIGLRFKDGAWRLELADAAPVSTAQVYDVTVGVVRSKWIVDVQKQVLVLDGPRFVAGHAYRVELPAGSLLVYLYPPPHTHPAHVTFDGPSDVTTNTDGIAIQPKSAL